MDVIEEKIWYHVSNKSLRKESKVVQTKKQYGDFSLTALSRVRRIEDLVLTQKIRPQDVIASPEVIDFMKQVGWYIETSNSITEKTRD